MCIKNRLKTFVHIFVSFKFKLSFISALLIAAFIHIFFVFLMLLLLKNINYSFTPIRVGVLSLSQSKKGVQRQFKQPVLEDHNLNESLSLKEEHEPLKEQSKVVEKQIEKYNTKDKEIKNQKIKKDEVLIKKDVKLSEIPVAMQSKQEIQQSTPKESEENKKEESPVSIKDNNYELLETDVEVKKQLDKSDHDVEAKDFEKQQKEEDRVKDVKQPVLEDHNLDESLLPIKEIDEPLKEQSRAVEKQIEKYNTKDKEIKNQKIKKDEVLIKKDVKLSEIPVAMQSKQEIQQSTPKESEENKKEESPVSIKDNNYELLETDVEVKKQLDKSDHDVEVKEVKKQQKEEDKVKDVKQPILKDTPMQEEDHAFTENQDMYKRDIKNDTQSSSLQYDHPPKLKNEAQIIKFITHHYPTEARMIGLDGHVQIQLDINAYGIVTKFHILFVSNDIFVPLCKPTIKKMRFIPAYKSNKPVMSTFIQSIQFRLE